MIRRAGKQGVGILGVAGLLLSGLAGIVATARPAAAATQPAVHLKPNQTIEITNPGFPAGVGAPYSLLFGFFPDDCSDAGNAFAFCDYYPIRLDDKDGTPLSTKALQSRLFSVVYTLKWNATNIDIPGNYPQPTVQYEMSVWDDPVVADDDPIPCDAATDPIVNFYICTLVDGGSAGGRPGGDESYYDPGYLQAPTPELFGMLPTRNAYAVTVANTLGAGTPYTLKIGLIESDANLNDLSIDVPPLDLSAVNSVASDAGLGSPLPTPAGPSSAGFDLNPAALGPDTDLDALGGGSLDLDPAVEQIIRGRNIRDLGAPGKASTGLMLFWLGGLPLVLGAGAVYWFLRRRASIFG